MMTCCCAASCGFLFVLWFIMSSPDMLHIALLYIVSSNFPAEAEKPYREAASVLIRPILHLMRIKQHTCHSVMS